MAPSLYETLGVEPGASPEEIQAAFRSLAQKHHPDKGGDEETMKAVVNAYTILRDGDRRKTYDETGSEEAAGANREAMPEHMAMVFNTFASVLGQLQPGHDPFAITGQLIQDNLSDAQQALGRLRAELRTLRATADKIPADREGLARYRQVADSLIGQKQHQIEQGEEQEAMITNALAFLREADTDGLFVDPESARSRSAGAFAFTINDLGSGTASSAWR